LATGFALAGDLATGLEAFFAAGFTTFFDAAFAAGFLAAGFGGSLLRVLAADLEVFTRGAP